MTSNLLYFLICKFTNFCTHIKETRTHSESLLCGPVGSPTRLIGIVLQPGGGGWPGGVMDGE